MKVKVQNTAKPDQQQSLGILSKSARPLPCDMYRHGLASNTIICNAYRKSNSFSWKIKHSQLMLVNNCFINV